MHKRCQSQTVGFVRKWDPTGSSCREDGSQEKTSVLCLSVIMTRSRSAVYACQQMLFQSCPNGCQASLPAFPPAFPPAAFSCRHQLQFNCSARSWRQLGTRWYCQSVPDVSKCIPLTSSGKRTELPHCHIAGSMPCCQSQEN